MKDEAIGGVKDDILKTIDSAMQSDKDAKESICKLMDDMTTSDDKNTVETLGQMAKIIIMKFCDNQMKRFDSDSEESDENVNDCVDETTDDTINEAVDDDVNNAIDETIDNEIDNNVDMTNTDVQEMTTDDEDSAPVFAVFYALNNAAYVAIDERMRMCVPVRNIAKAYCVKADVNSIANGQNELSKYKLDKLKPLQIKFLTQKEYDDTIGKALQMKAMIASMPVSSANTNISGGNKVTNFASGTSSKSNSHIGDKKEDSGHNFSYSRYGHTDEPDYDASNRFYNNPYSSPYPLSNTITKPVKKYYSVTDMLESPKCLYEVMHQGIDDDDIFNYRKSYMNDIADVKSLDTVGDFDVLIPLLNDTITAISNTRSGYLVTEFISTGKVIDNDYIMDIDYSLFDKAISEWNAANKPCKIMYVEDFDPTILNFKKNIKSAARKYCYDEKELAAMAIYNYTRCILAYESFKIRNGII